MASIRRALSPRRPVNQLRFITIVVTALVVIGAITAVGIVLMIGLLCTCVGSCRAQACAADAEVGERFCSAWRMMLAILWICRVRDRCALRHCWSPALIVRA